MNNLFITIIMLFFPVSAMASGTDALSLVGLFLLVFTIVVVSLLLSKFTIKQKIIVFFVYFFSALLSLMATAEIPYSRNMYLINMVNTALPLLTWVTVYAYFIKKSK